MKDIQFNFENKNFVVVGASSGIGKKITLDLAEAGAHVLAVARNENRLRELQNLYASQIKIHVLDVIKADSKDWNQAIGNFVNNHGKIHGGVYTAGITGNTGLKMYDDDMAKQIMDTSFWGAAKFIQSVSRKKYAEKGSSYILLSSASAYGADKGMFVYSAAKMAIQVAVRSWAKEICRDMHRINTISPGWVETEMTKEYMQSVGWDNLKDEALRKYRLGLGKPEDISGVTLFLLSDAARWITGTDIVVDGGVLLGAD